MKLDGSIVVHKDSDKEWRVELVDMIDEQAKFPQAIPTTVTKITVDFGKVTYLNSSGLMLWVRWANALGPNVQLEIERLTTAVIRVCELSLEVLPPKAIVRSLSCDYFCNNCGAFKRILIENKNLDFSMVQKCDDCQADLELEFSPDTYKTMERYAPK